MTAARLRVVDIALDEQPVTLRLPFRYGATTLSKARQAFVCVRIRVDGFEATGQAAELMAPKWFDKSPELSNDENIAQLRQALTFIRRRYLDTSEQLTAFGLHALHDAEHMSEASLTGLNGLVAGFGSALIDKAIIAALCRLEGLSFFELIRRNRIGLTAATAPDLSGVDFGKFLRSLRPARSIFARHTIGAIDALTDAEIALGDLKNDGLPESLSAAIDRYGLKSFKIKLTGKPAFDLARLRAIARLLDEKVGAYSATLDANEQFVDAEEFGDFWTEISAHPGLRKLYDSICFVEQPIARSAALEHQLGELGTRMSIAIDESDENIAAFPRAVALGYCGVSSKSCKGVYRSLLNRARVAMLNGSTTMRQGGYFVSAEDLCAQAGLAVQQDLALATLIGCRTTERNGHHFGHGNVLRAPEEYFNRQADFPKLYENLPDRLSLAIRDGKIDLDSLFAAAAYG